MSFRSTLFLVFTSFFWSTQFFGQTDLEIQTSLRELTVARGSISVESRFSVDSVNMDKYHKIVYLDNSFARRSKLDENARYRVKQLMFQENLPMYAFFKNAPDSVHIDSLILGKEEGTGANTFLIYRGTFLYNEGRKTYLYHFDKGYVVDILVHRKGKIWYSGNFEGLYTNKGKTWPVMKNYDKQGKLEDTSIIVYLPADVHEIIWEEAP